MSANEGIKDAELAHRRANTSGAEHLLFIRLAIFSETRKASFHHNSFIFIQVE